MADVSGGSRMGASNGNARASGPVPVQQSDLQLPQPPPDPATRGRDGSPSQLPAGMRTPRDILADRTRRTREKQQREEQQQGAALAEQQRRTEERRALAASGTSAHRRSQSSTAVPVQSYANPTYDRSSVSAQPLATVPQTGPQQRQRANTQFKGQPVPVEQQPTSKQNSQQRMVYASPQVQPAQVSQPLPAGERQPRGQPQPRSAAEQQPESTSQPQVRTNQSSFPHAFERWEELSSHWEGLTSFWIHKLEHDAEEVSRIPLGQQMSRQITDLAAAGANLFHAVVELQRLRASSERKFQRWYFETRTDMERSSELNAELDRLLREERQRTRGSGSQIEKIEMARQKAEKLAEEAKRELMISKDEARRAWEELGRREDEERDRVQALREGTPIHIGGVQVFPTMAAASRQNSGAQRPSTGEQQYATQSGYTQDYPRATSPTDTDPFTERYQDPQMRGGAVMYNDLPSNVTPAASTASQRTMIPAPSGRPNVSQGSATAQPQGMQYTTSAAGGNNYAAATAAEDVRDSGSFGPTTSASLIDDPSDDELPEDEDGYQKDERGNIRYDNSGRPLLDRRGLRLSNVEGGDDDEMDVRADIERERELSRRYGAASSTQQQSLQQQQQQQSQPLLSSMVPSTSVPTYPTIPPSSSAAMAAAQTGTLTAGGPLAARQDASRLQAPPPPQAVQSVTAGQDAAHPDYEGEGYDEYEQDPPWDVNMRHHHPTRLSDVPEEDERSRTTGE